MLKYLAKCVGSNPCKVPQGNQGNIDEYEYEYEYEWEWEGRKTRSSVDEGCRL